MIDTGITISVYPDPDYHFEIELSDTYGLTYVEHGRDLTINIGFGSLAEMEAVALAMIKAVKASKS